MQPGIVMETLLLEQVLQPLARGCDALGDYGIGVIAQHVAERDARRFGDLLSRQVSGHAER